MNFLLSHWHCIVPVILIVVVLFIHGRAEKKNLGGKK